MNHAGFGIIHHALIQMILTDIIVADFTRRFSMMVSQMRLKIIFFVINRAVKIRNMYVHIFFVDTYIYLFIYLLSTLLTHVSFITNIDYIGSTHL